MEQQLALVKFTQRCVIENTIANAKNYMASGDYHSAVGELIDCENATNDDSIISECEDMLVSIYAALLFECYTHIIMQHAQCCKGLPNTLQELPKGD